MSNIDSARFLLVSFDDKQWQGDTHANQVQWPPYGLHKALVVDSQHFKDISLFFEIDVFPNVLNETRKLAGANLLF